MALWSEDNPIKKLIASLAGTARQNEIMVLYRIPGRFKILAPPLLYSGGAAFRVREQFGKLKGLKSFRIDEGLGTIVVEYERELTAERDLFLMLDQLLTPELEQSNDHEFKELVTNQRLARVKKGTYKAAITATMGYLIYLHASRLKRWILSPLRYWAPLAAVIFLVWAHRKVIDRGLGVAH